MAKRIIRRREVEKKTGLSKTAIYDKLTRNAKRPQLFDPTFPRPVPLGGRAVGWLESEVDDWIEAQAAKRDQAAA